MNERHCTRCGQVISKGLEGDLCSKCLDKRQYYGDSYYDVTDMSRKLGISEGHVRRKARKDDLPGHVPGIKRYLWRKPVIDQWIHEAQLPPRVPSSPVQKKAFAMCKCGDHSWLSDAEYAGSSYSRETQVGEGRYLITVGFVHTCYFCGHKEYFL